MQVEAVLALIEKIIEEHRQILRKVDTSVQVANDASAMRELEAGREAFMPGRFGQQPGLQQLRDLMEMIDRGLRAHFNREETALPMAVEQYGNEEMASALHDLLLEHEDLRDRLARSKKQVAALYHGSLSRHVWEASAHDMRAYITHTRKLLGAHTGFEKKLLATLRNRLHDEVKKKN